MTRGLVQAGMRFGFLALLLAAALFAGNVHAAQVNTRESYEAPKTGPETGAEVSFGDLMDGVDDLIPSFLRKDDTSSKTAVPAEPAKSNKETAPKTDVPVTRTPDPAPQTPVTPSATPAYRVYPSPYVPEEPAPKSIRGVMPESDPAEMAPPPDVQRLTAQETKTEKLPPPQGPLTTPITGMVRQLFPILPPGAPRDMPPQLLPLASSRDLTSDQSPITRAIVVVHDVTRDASETLAMLMTLAGTDNGTTLILAPQFLLEVDITRFLTYLPGQGENVARWPVSLATGWQTGEDSLAQPPLKGISSFMALDYVLLYLADRQTFPGLQQVVVAGHGMGGDFVQRYAAVGFAPSMLAAQKLPVRFLAANASSYLYFTSVRPAMAGGSAFGMPDTAKCKDVNEYPYGLGHLVSYARRTGGEAIRLRYPERSVMYLISEKIGNDPFLDTGCAAMAQGKDRLARGRNFARYLTMSFGEAAQKTQSFVMVPSAAYDPVALFGSYCGMAMLFGDGECKRE